MHTNHEILLLWTSESNIEEVLSLPDLSHVPKAFLTEIQQDQAYSTIYSELQKKMPHRKASSPPPPIVVLPTEESTRSPRPQVVSPRVITLDQDDEDDHDHNDDDDNDDDEISLIDDKSSTVSSLVNLASTADGYDTDIETGRVSETFASITMNSFE